MDSTDSNGPVCSDTEELIRDCLDHCSLDDALFLAELHYIRVKSSHALLLYCDCLLRLNRRHEVYNLLRSHTLTNAKLRYLFAKCCFDLNKKDECFRTLTERNQEGTLHSAFRGTPSESFAHSLLSTLQCLSGRYSAAAKESESAVRGNNFLWSSICKIVQFDSPVVDDLFGTRQTSSFRTPRQPLLKALLNDARLVLIRLDRHKESHLKGCRSVGRLHSIPDQLHPYRRTLHGKARVYMRLVRSEEPGCSTKIRIPKMREVGIGPLLQS